MELFSQFDFFFLNSPCIKQYSDNTFHSNTTVESSHNTTFFYLFIEHELSKRLSLTSAWSDPGRAPLGDPCQPVSQPLPQVVHFYFTHFHLTYFKSCFTANAAQRKKQITTTYYYYSASPSLLKSCFIKILAFYNKLDTSISMILNY